MDKLTSATMFYMKMRLDELLATMVKIDGEFCAKDNIGGEIHISEEMKKFIFYVLSDYVRGDKNECAKPISE